jgi:hypothetical protein
METELAQAEAAYLCAEKVFSQATTAVLRFEREHLQAGAVMLVDSKAYVRTNALSLADPELQKLCCVREDARARRNELLNRRAQLLKAAGKVR